MFIFGPYINTNKVRFRTIFVHLLCFPLKMLDIYCDMIACNQPEVWVCISISGPVQLLCICRTLGFSYPSLLHATRRSICPATTGDFKNLIHLKTTYKLLACLGKNPYFSLNSFRLGPVNQEIHQFFVRFVEIICYLQSQKNCINRTLN